MEESNRHSTWVQGTREENLSVFPQYGQGDWVPQPRRRCSLFDKHALISLGLWVVQTQSRRDVSSGWFSGSGHGLQTG